jgi:Cell division protein CrgA
MATKAKSGPGRAQRKGRSSGGRATAPSSIRSDRYTPPTSKHVQSSPRWLGLVIVALFVVGVVLVILNYTNALPGGVNNAWLIAAIGAIFVGLILATRYR